MFPGPEIRSWVELGILIFLAIKAIGALVQKTGDTSSAHGGRLDVHEKLISALSDRVQSFREIRVADRLSRLESSLSNIETYAREHYITKELCGARMGASEREHEHDHPC